MARNMSPDMARDRLEQSGTDSNTQEGSGRRASISSGIEIREDTCITIAFPMHTRVCPASLLIHPSRSYTLNNYQYRKFLIVDECYAEEVIRKCKTAADVKARGGKGSYI